MEELYSNYATALYGLVEREKSEDYLSWLHSFCGLLKDNPEVKVAFSSPNLSKMEKERLLDICLGKDPLPYLKAFLMQVILHHRVNKIDGIVEAYQKLIDEEVGRKQGIVYSPSPLDAKQMKELEDAFAKRIGCEVRLKNRVDETLLGGVKVALDGKVYDGSLRAKLLELQKNLKK